METAIDKSRIEVMLEDCTIWLRDDSVLMVSLREGAVVGFNEARKIMDIIEVLSKRSRRSIVFDIRPAQNLDMAARVVLTGERFAAVKNSVALIVPDFIAKLTANFAFLLEKPSFPIRAFITEKEALRGSRERSNAAVMYWV